MLLLANEEVRVNADRDVLVASPLKIYYLEGLRVVCRAPNEMYKSSVTRLRHT